MKLKTLKINLNKSVAIYQSETSEKIAKFLLAKRFTLDFISILENELLNRCFLDDNENIVAKEISGAIHFDVLKTN